MGWGVGGVDRVWVLTAHEQGLSCRRRRRSLPTVFDWRCVCMGVRANVCLCVHRRFLGGVGWVALRCVCVNCRPLPAQDGATAAHLAAMSGYHQCLKCLLQAKARFFFLVLRLPLLRSISPVCVADQSPPGTNVLRPGASAPPHTHSFAHSLSLLRHARTHACTLNQRHLACLRSPLA